MCVAFSVDNASVNMGKINSIKSRVLVKNPDLYFVGCSSHMAHNAACIPSKHTLVLSWDFQIAKLFC
jgi:hypothetical protein